MTMVTTVDTTTRFSGYVLGLDLSLTSTGIATIDPDGKPYVDSILTRGRRNDGLAERWARISAINGGLAEFRTKVRLIVVEGPSHGSIGGSAWDRAALWWLVVSQAVTDGVPVAVVAPSTRAKWAAGTGRADKAAVASAMSRLWPDLLLSNADEADALALAHMGALKLGYPVPTRAHHKPDVWKSVGWPTIPERNAA